MEKIFQAKIVLLFQELYPISLFQPQMEQFDYIIIGAGSAGCVLANRLSTNPKITVLLLEAGGKDTNPWIHIPGGYFKTMHNPSTDWCFKTEKEKGLNNREMNFPRGKTLGKFFNQWDVVHQRAIQ